MNKSSILSLVLTLYLIFIFSIPSSEASVVVKDSSKSEWLIQSQTYIEELSDIKIDNANDKITIKLQDKYISDINKSNYDNLWNAIDKKKLEERANKLNENKFSSIDSEVPDVIEKVKNKEDFDKDIQKVNKTPVRLDIYIEVRDEENCIELEKEGYICTISPTTGFIEYLVESVDLGYIDITKDSSIEKIKEKYGNRGSRLELNIGFGTAVIIFESGQIGETKWFFQGNATAGTGNNWSTAYTFKDAVTWFEDNPQDEYWVDFIEDARYLKGFQTWYAGAFTELRGERIAGETIIEVANNSEFVGNQNLFPIDAGYMAYAKCTNTTNDTLFSSCGFNYVYDGGSTAYARTVLYYDNTSTPSNVYEPFKTKYARLMDATCDDCVTYNDTEYIDGTKSLMVHSNVSRLVIMNGIKNITGYNEDAYCGHANEFRFSIWVNDSVILNTTEIKEFSSTQGRKHDYGMTYRFEQELIPNQWNNFTINIADNIYGEPEHEFTTLAPDVAEKYRGFLARRTEISYMDISTFMLTFENASDKTILIDRVGCYNENPFPKEIAPNVIESAVQYYCTNNILEDTYVKDAGFTYLNADLGQTGMYLGGLNSSIMMYVQFGEDDDYENGTRFTGWTYGGMGWRSTPSISTARSQFVSIGANLPDFDPINRYFGTGGISLPSTKLGDFNLSKMYVGRLNSLFNTNRLHDIYSNPSGNENAILTWSSNQRWNDIDMKNLKIYSPLGRVAYTSSTVPAIVLKNIEYIEVINESYFGQFGTTVGGWTGDIRIVDTAFPDTMFTEAKNVYIQLRAGLTGQVNLYFINSLNIYAQYSNGTVVPNANVTMYDANGNVSFSSLTDANGYLLQNFTYRHLHHKGGMRGVTTGWADIYLWNNSEYSYNEEYGQYPTKPPFTLNVTDDKGQVFTMVNDFDWYDQIDGYNLYPVLYESGIITLNELNCSSPTEYSDSEITVSGNMNILNGCNLTLINSSIIVEGDTEIFSNGTFTGGTLQNTHGSLTINSGGTYSATSGITNITSENTYGWTLDADTGTLNANNGTFVFSSGTQTSFDIGSNNLYNVIIDGTGDIFSASDMTIDNDLTLESVLAISDESLNRKSLNVTGDVIINSGGQLYGYTESQSFGSLTINSGGTYSATTNTTIINGDFSNSGTFTHNNGTVNFQGSATTLTTSTVFYQVDIIGNLTLDAENNYSIMNITSTGNLTYNTDHTDEEINYYKQAGGYIWINDTTTLISNLCYFNGASLTDNTTGASYYIDQIETDSIWKVPYLQQGYISYITFPIYATVNITNIDRTQTWMTDNNDLTGEYYENIEAKTGDMINIIANCTSTCSNSSWAYANITEEPQINITLSCCDTPPSPPDLVSPPNGTIFLNTTTYIEFDWNASTDYELDTITYNLSIDNDSDMSSPLYTVGGLINTTYTYDTSSLSANNTYYWQVLAVTDYANTNSSIYNFQFITSSPDLPQATYVVLSPPYPYNNEDLICSGIITDPLFGYNVRGIARFYTNQGLIDTQVSSYVASGSEVELTLSSSFTSNGEEWYCTLTPQTILTQGYPIMSNNVTIGYGSIAERIEFDRNRSIMMGLIIIGFIFAGGILFYHSTLYKREDDQGIKIALLIVGGVSIASAFSVIALASRIIIFDTIMNYIANIALVIIMAMTILAFVYSILYMIRRRAEQIKGDIS